MHHHVAGQASLLHIFLMDKSRCGAVASAGQHTLTDVSGIAVGMGPRCVAARPLAGELHLADMLWACPVSKAVQVVMSAVLCDGTCMCMCVCALSGPAHVRNLEPDCVERHAVKAILPSSGGFRV